MELIFVSDADLERLVELLLCLVQEATVVVDLAELLETDAH